jgi:hypothetical protein
VCHALGAENRHIRRPTLAVVSKVPWLKSGADERPLHPRRASSSLILPGAAQGGRVDPDSGPGCHSAELDVPIWGRLAIWHEVQVEVPPSGVNAEWNGCQEEWRASGMDGEWSGRRSVVDAKRRSSGMDDIWRGRHLVWTTSVVDDIWRVCQEKIKVSPPTILVQVHDLQWLI